MEFEWKRYVGKELTLFYEDLGRVVPKKGILKFANSTHLFITHDDWEEGITISRIVRIEIGGD